MFCAVPVMLEDGRVFVNGGDGTRERTSTFDYRTNTWTRVQDMNVGRWYPGSVALPDSQVFTALGDPGSRYSEKWTASTGWTYVTGADLQEAILNFPGQTVHWLPYLFLNSDGRIFHSGPSQQMNWITHTGNGSVASANLNNTWFPKYSTSVMYDEGKILVAGGQVGGNNMAATNQAMVINLNGATPTKTAIAPMNYARKFNNGVVLPTGEMLVIGGNTSGAEFSDDGTVLTPEIWNPSTQTWRTVAQHSVPRNYHSVALLMADGRVFSGGGGLCDCSADHPDHQIYSPPYLFNADGSLATRPAISSAPNVVSYGRTNSVAATPGVHKFSLIKMSGTTHNLNSDLRYLNVPFSEVSSGQYQLRLHSNRNVMTPGYWMLFAVNSQGVPSVAKVIAVSSVDAPVVTNPGAQSSPIESAESLAIVASDPTGDPLTYSASGLPPGLTIDSNSGVIDGVVKAVGLYTATVGVFDGANTTSVKFVWSVSAASPVRYVKLEARSEVNGNPWSSGAELNLVDEYGVALRRGAWRVRTDSEETQGGSYAAANVLDGNANTYWQTQGQGSIPAHPHWLVVDMAAATSVGGFRYLPRQDATDGRIKDYRFYVSADGINWGKPVAQGAFANNGDEKSVAVSETWTPDISGPGAQSSMVGETIRLPIQAVDHDGDPLSYGASGLPPGLTIDNAGVIAGTIANALNSIGAYEVTLTVRDNRGFASSVAFTWTVQAQALTLNLITSTPKPVNTPLGYTAIGNNGINPRYKWQFGDGTAETAYSSSPNASHSYSQPGIYMVRLTATDDRGVEQSITFVQVIHLPLTARRPMASTSIAYEQRTTSNSRVWVVNADNNTVAVFDAATNAKLAELPVGAAPRSLAVGPAGSAAAGRVWVSNKGAANTGANITVLNADTLGVVGSISLPLAAQPYGLVFAPDGSAAYVALEGMGQVLKLDPRTGNVLGSVAVGPDPRHLSVSANGGTLLVARFVTPPLPGEATAAVQTTLGGAKVGGEVVVVNTASMSTAKTMVLQFGDKNDTEAQGRGVPNYLGAPAISPDGSAAWVPSKQDNVQRGGAAPTATTSISRTPCAPSVRASN